MSKGVKTYYIEGEKIYKVSSDTKRLFKHLAGLAIPCVTIFFEKKSENLEILEIRVDPAHFDSEGRRALTDLDKRRIVSVISKFLPEKETDDKVVEFKPRPFVKCLSERQKDMIKIRFEKDFGPGSWDRIPASYKINFWEKGRGGIIDLIKTP